MVFSSDIANDCNSNVYKQIDHLEQLEGNDQDINTSSCDKLILKGTDDIVQAFEVGTIQCYTCLIYFKSVFGVMF